MADNANFTSGGNGEESALAEIAYRLYLDVAYAENMDVREAPNPAGEKASRTWILKTYGWCYRNAKKGSVLSSEVKDPT